MSSIPVDGAYSHECFRAEVSKLLAETAKIQAELHEVNARTINRNAESKWYAPILGAALFAAGGALVKIFF